MIYALALSKFAGLGSDRRWAQKGTSAEMKLNCARYSPSDKIYEPKFAINRLIRISIHCRNTALCYNC